MDPQVERIIELVSNNAVGIGILVTFFAAALSPPFRESVTSLFKLFLYKDSAFDVDSRRETLKELGAKVKETRKELDEILVRGQSESLRNKISEYVESSFKDLVNDKIQNPELIKDTVVSNLQSIIHERTSEFLSKTNVADIESARQAELETQRREQNRKYLIESLSREAKNASTLKMVMINLFVITTILFFAFNVLQSPDFTKSSSAVVLGIYFSLGAFMIYIIRTSHYRSLTLLSIQEDDKNYTDAIHFIDKFKSGMELTEHDVEIIRMIMLNRSEREHKTDHPYEVILKGISGSNIQFKGGKMELGKNGAGSK